MPFVFQGMVAYWGKDFSIANPVPKRHEPSRSHLLLHLP